MEKSMRSSGTVLILTLALLYLAEAGRYGGVKTGPLTTRISRAADKPGHCYIRLPDDSQPLKCPDCKYSEVLDLNNATGHIQLVHLDSGRFNTKISQQIQNDDWVTVLDCCDGYVREKITGKCTIHCAGGCSGGVCAPGGISTCENGRQPQNGFCEPVCRPLCHKDAYCSAPDVCTCKEGFEEKVPGQCSPICSGGCANGDCVAFEVCQCKQGYAMNDNKICEAVCEGGCPHGDCTKPGHCTCHEGYIHPPGDTEACQPHCGPNGCPNGECTSPGVCTCRPGYKQDDQTRACIPDCQPACGRNSHCVRPGRCVCDSGFYQDPHTRNCIYSHQQTDYQQTNDQQTDDQQTDYQQTNYQQTNYQ